MCVHHIVAQGVSVRISLHPHAIHDVTCLSVRLLSLRVCRRLPLLFHTLPVLCPALHLQCRHRRGLKPQHSRRMRSIALWRYTTLSQQAADAVSSCTQVKMKGRPRIVETSKGRMSRYLDTSTVPLERNLYGHPLAR